MIEGDISHDQLTRFLSSKAFTSKDLWGQVNVTVRQIEQEDGCLIFDDTIQEKIPVALKVVHKPHQFSDVKTRKVKRDQKDTL